MYVVRRAFRHLNQMVTPGSEVEPGSIKNFKSRLRDRFIIEVTEQDFDSWNEYFKTKYGTEIKRLEYVGQNDPGQNDPGQNDPGQNDPGQNDPGQNDPAGEPGAPIEPATGDVPTEPVDITGETAKPIVVVAAKTK